MWVSLTGAAKVIGGMARPAAGDQSFLKGLIETGKLGTVIDRRYSLDEIADAHRHAEAGHKKGHVVILLEQTAGTVLTDHETPRSWQAWSSDS